MPNILIRDLTQQQLNTLDDLARQVRVSRNQYLTQMIEREVTSNPEIVLGYVEVFGGELAPDDDCPQCNTPFGNGGIFVGFTPVRSFGPVCRRCALGN